MAKHIILAQSEVTAEALKAFLTMAKEQYSGEITKDDRHEPENAPAGCGPNGSVPEQDGSTVAKLQILFNSLRSERCNRDRDDTRRKPEQIIWDGSSVDLESYRIIADEIETRASSADGYIPVGEIVVLVDYVDLSQLDPMSPNGWDGVIAMLILTFPEIRWVFGVVKGIVNSKNDESENLARDHGLQSLVTASTDPLFDGTGLREWVHSRARKPDGDLSPDAVKHIPKRTKIAVAVDEERNYAYLHGYVAYRFGFRAYAVTEEAQLEQLLGLKGQLKINEQFQVSIEDMFLNFPDRSDRHLDTHWSDLEQRTAKLPALAQHGVSRIFVTSGQHAGADQDRLDRNRDLRNDLREEGRLGTILYKPIAGIFNLWTSAKLRNKLRDGRQRGQADGFIWPPRHDGNTASGQSHDHSAPGRLLEIATRLEARAERLLEDVHCAIRAVQGAVLSIEAMELLGEKAQTTFLEALALKHEFEAKAECQFYGVQSHFDVKSRIKDIRLEVHELGRYFNRAKRKEAEWHAEAAILNCLICTYQDYNQFDEEMEIQARSRAVHRRLWFKRRMFWFGDQLRWVNPVYWTACYVHGLLKSLPVFVLAILLWIVSLSALYTVTGPDDLPVASGESIHRGIEDAVSSFFSIGTPTRHEDKDHPQPIANTSAPFVQATNLNAQLKQLDERLERLEANTVSVHKKTYERKFPVGYVSVICLAILSGCLHVGVFIAHLYAIISRK